jgi:glycosyltransferase involved in cell wall biosynthesis
MRDADGLRVLYLVYWGVAEPLGQSLVLPAVLRLAQLGIALTLVTWEKPQDLGNEPQMREIRERLRDAGITWIPLRYHKRPKVPATAFDVLHGAARSALARVRGRVDLVHARTFVTGPSGVLASWTLRAPLVYHNEGFYPDEQVDSGVWGQGSLPHRVGRSIEGFLYDRADGVITLSERARAVVQARPAVARRGTPVIVVPSAVDLDRFRLRPRVPRDDGVLRLVYAGGVGGRYRVDVLARFVEVARRGGPVHLHVLSAAEPALVAETLARGGLPRDAWSLECLPHREMPEALGGQDAGLLFLARGLSEHGGSPTKVGEYWACGLPVVATANVSDVDAIVRAEGVGVIVEEDTDPAFERAAEALRALLADPELPARCRRAAEVHYGLEPAVRRQADLYRQLTGRGARDA